MRSLPCEGRQELKCRGADSNRGTTAGQGPKPCAVGRSWLPLLDDDCWQIPDEIIKDALVREAYATRAFLRPSTNSVTMADATEYLAGYARTRRRTEMMSSFRPNLIAPVKADCLSNLM